MNERLVIDTSVYLNYAAYGKLYRLINEIKIYEIKVYINIELLEEIERNLERVLIVKTHTIEFLISEIKQNTLLIPTISIFSNCPDEKDNFLFDIAIQSGSEVLVTKENALLNWSESPILIHDIEWFKEKYVVD